MVDVLVNFACPEKYNTFIVASVYRILMRWFIALPETERQAFIKHIQQRLMDERASIGDETHGRLADEARTVLMLFMRCNGAIDTADGTVASKQSDGFVEQNCEHWITDEAIVTLRSLIAERQPPTSRFSILFVYLWVSIGSSSASSETSVDRRRRHQSAIQPPTSEPPVPIVSWAMDDSCADNVKSQSFSRHPVIGHTQITVRGIFGRQSWTLRQFDGSNGKSIGRRRDDDDSGGIDGAGQLLQHLCDDANTVRVPSSEQLMRSLRILDTVPGLENHTVGVVYAGPGQNTEAQMLSNRYGSERYVKFLRLAIRWFWVDMGIEGYWVLRFHSPTIRAD
jgi:hypothetical protein